MIAVLAEERHQNVGLIHVQRYASPGFPWLNFPRHQRKEKWEYGEFRTMHLYYYIIGAIIHRIVELKNIKCRIFDFCLRN